MKSGKVIKAFPYAFDGITVSHMALDARFPPAGASIADSAFDGLVAAGYIEETAGEKVPAEEALNRQIIEAFDRRLAAASDQELKDIIARSGTPYSGNMVHAHLVFAAKQQMLAEMNGAMPKGAVDPNAGVTEQPLSKPGEATPPSAAAAVDRQQAQAEAGKRADEERLADAKRDDAQAAAAAGENKATDQFGAPLQAGQGAAGDQKLDEMTVAELKDMAEKRSIDLGDATKKADIIAAIEKAGQ